MPVTRRLFCTQASCAASLALLPSVFAACNSPTAPSLEDHPIPSVDAAIVNGTLVVNIDTTSPLATAGHAALIENGLGKFLVARTGAETFLAVTAVCTHFGCTITRHDSQVYECPCHGSRFTTAGAVVRGPASRPLRSFPTQFANDVLTITV
jgi:cytochrome b6-f complex iron-sulfur subunit